MTRHDWEDGQYRKEKPVMSLAGLLVALAVSGAFWGLLLWALWPE